MNAKTVFALTRANKFPWHHHADIKFRAPLKWVWLWPAMLLPTLDCSSAFCEFIHARLKAMWSSAAGSRCFAQTTFFFLTHIKQSTAGRFWPFLFCSIPVSLSLFVSSCKVTAESPLFFLSVNQASVLLGNVSDLLFAKFTQVAPQILLWKSLWTAFVN